MIQTFALKGDILFSESPKQIAVFPNHYVVCADGICQGVFKHLPQQFAQIPVEDYTGKLIVPGLIDLHAHAPQFAFRALGMDLELLDWLASQTFPQEAKYANLEYAQAAYPIFVDALRRSSTTRAVLFGTLHQPATLYLMQLLEESGLETYVGKVNMDRNSPPILCETSAQASLEATQTFLQACQNFCHTRPILTPRFLPTCSDALMEGLHLLQQQTGLPVQSHLSENLSEIAWVQSLCPASNGYADAYARFGLLGGAGCPTIMAHCVHSNPAEQALLYEQGVWIAHCPESNTNLSSGIAPVRTFLQQGQRLGLGSDIAGGTSLSIFHAITATIQTSKLRWRLVDDTLSPITFPEAFWMATRGGGSFFGSVGAFEAGYAFDALILDDTTLPCPFSLTPLERLIRIAYLAEDTAVVHKYVAGRTLF